LNQCLLGLSQHPGLFQRRQFDLAPATATFGEGRGTTTALLHLSANSLISCDNFRWNLPDDLLAGFRKPPEPSRNLPFDLTNRFRDLVRLGSVGHASRLLLRDSTLDCIDLLEEFHLSFLERGLFLVQAFLGLTLDFGGLDVPGDLSDLLADLLLFGLFLSPFRADGGQL